MSILLKTSLSLCAVCASTLAAFEYSHDYITNLLVRSTKISLRDPELRDDVYILLRRLLTRLVNDSTTREKTAEFLKAAMHSEKLENSVLNVTLKNMQTIEYQAEALNLMVAISDHVLRDETLKLKTKNLSSTYKEAAAYMQNVKKIKIGRKNQEILKTDFEIPRVDFNELVKEYYEDYNAEQLKELIRKHISPHIFKMPEHDVQKSREIKDIPMLGVAQRFQAITDQISAELPIPIESAVQAVKYEKRDVLKIKHEEVKRLEMEPIMENFKGIQFSEPESPPEIAAPQKIEKPKFEEITPTISFPTDQISPIDQEIKSLEEQFFAEEVQSNDFQVQKLENEQTNIDENTKNLIKSASSLAFKAESSEFGKIREKNPISFLKNDPLKIEKLIQKLKLESLDLDKAKIDEDFHVELQSPESIQDQELVLRKPIDIDSLNLESVQIEEPFHVDLLSPESKDNRETLVKEPINIESLNLEKSNIDESFQIDLFNSESIDKKEDPAFDLSTKEKNLAVENLEKALEFHKQEILQNSEGHILEAMKELSDEIESFGSPMKLESIEKELLLERFESQHIKY